MASDVQAASAIDTVLDRTIALGCRDVGLRVSRHLPRRPSGAARIDGTVVVVTGAALGIGLAACRGFAQLGARVRAVARDDRRAEGAARQIRQAAPKADVRRLGCDMASIQALRSLAVRLNARPVNLTAPDPVTNAELSHALGRVLHRPAVLPVPAPALRVLYGEMAQIVTTGQRVVPRRLRKPDSSSATPTSSRLCVTFSQRRADPGLTKGGRRYCFASASARRRGR